MIVKLIFREEILNSQRFLIINDLVIMDLNKNNNFVKKNRNFNRHIF